MKPSEKSGRRIIPKDSRIPIIMDAIKAPDMLPIPPTITTQKAIIIICISIPKIPLTMGAAVTDAIPASAMPAIKTKRNTRDTFIPTQLVISGLTAQALIMLPILVLNRTTYMRMQRNIVTAMIKRSYFVMRTPFTVKNPWNI